MENHFENCVCTLCTDDSISTCSVDEADFQPLQEHLVTMDAADSDAESIDSEQENALKYVLHVTVSAIVVIISVQVHVYTTLICVQHCVYGMHVKIVLDNLYLQMMLMITSIILHSPQHEDRYSSSHSLAIEPAASILQPTGCSAESRGW